MSMKKKVLVSAFILLNFLTMLRIYLPEESKFFQTVYRPVDSYLSFFSLYQTWRMFSPNPSRTNSFITAKVHFDDETTSTYVFPKSSEMSLFQKYKSGERFRVFSEVVRKDENSFLWRDSARFALRKLRSTSYNKIPLKVELIRHWDVIPDMDKEFRSHKSNKSDYQNYKFYTYEVI